MDIEKAKKAIELSQSISYMESTTGFIALINKIDDEIKWAFEKSVSPTFREEVKSRPEVYFEHYGYVNGLRQITEVIARIHLTAETAKKDLEKWESRMNQRSKTEKRTQSLAKHT